MPDVTIEVVQGDALRTPADVLVLKYAQGLYGVDLIAAGRMNAGGYTIDFPKPGEVRLEETRGTLAAPRVLFVGVPPLFEFRYAEIRQFASTALAELAPVVPEARTIAFTLHGPGYGLDEAEAFESEVAGIVTAIRSGATPAALERVQIVQLDAGSAERLQAQLRTLLPEPVVRSVSGPGPAPLRMMSTPATAPATPEGWLQGAGFTSDAKPHVFVAMPFRESMDDLYHYGIQNAVRTAGYVCERADLSAFTGDVMEWVRSRIRSSALVIAEMSDANPNVYLEVGFAWGVDVPTVLIARQGAELKFDIRGQRCLLYSRIQDLEQALTNELTALANGGG